MKFKMRESPTNNPLDYNEGCVTSVCSEGVEQTVKIGVGGGKGNMANWDTVTIYSDCLAVSLYDPR